MSKSSFSRLGNPLEKEAFLQKSIDGAWNGVRDNVVNPVYNTVANVGQGIVGATENVLTAVPRMAGAGAETAGKTSGGLGGAAQGFYDGASDSLGHSYDSTVSNLNRIVSSPWNGPAALVAASPTPQLFVGPPAPKPFVGPPAPVDPPAPVSPLPPAPQVATALAPASRSVGRPTPAQLQRFRTENYRGGRGRYDPNSSVDRAKMQQLMGKSAGKMDGALSFGRNLFNDAHAAVKGFKDTAHAALPGGLSTLRPLALPLAGTASAGYIGHEIGQNSGKSEGLRVGLDKGMQSGIQAMQSNQPGDPGILGRLMAVFAGQRQGPSGAEVYNNLQGDKENMIRAILSGGQTKKAGVDQFLKAAATEEPSAIDYAKRRARAKVLLYSLVGGGLGGAGGAMGGHAAGTYGEAFRDGSPQETANSAIRGGVGGALLGGAVGAGTGLVSNAVRSFLGMDAVLPTVATSRGADRSI